jgi:hypothetical protein
MRNFGARPTTLYSRFALIPDDEKVIDALTTFDYLSQPKYFVRIWSRRDHPCLSWQLCLKGVDEVRSLGSSG